MTKQTLLQMFLDYAMPPLLTALGAALVWALTKLAAWLHSKESESKLLVLTATVADLAQSIVAELNATLRPQLASALADGQITEEEGAKLKAIALGILQNKLPAGLRNVASQVFGSAVDTWLGGHIERAVSAQKADLPSAP